jgi:hypothetical protein
LVLTAHNNLLDTKIQSKSTSSSIMSINIGINGFGRIGR